MQRIGARTRGWSAEKSFGSLFIVIASLRYLLKSDNYKLQINKPPLQGKSSVYFIFNAGRGNNKFLRQRNVRTFYLQNYYLSTLNHWCILFLIFFCWYNKYFFSVRSLPQNNRVHLNICQARRIIKMNCKLFYEQTKFIISAANP